MLARPVMPDLRRHAESNEMRVDRANASPCDRMSPECRQPDIQAFQGTINCPR